MIAGKTKTSLYFPSDLLDEIQAEARRLDRPVSWVLQQAWKLSASKVKVFPGKAELDLIAAGV